MDSSYSNTGGFGSGGVQAPVISGAGDIVLATEKKSHKGIIIALVLVMLIIGGLFTAIFLMPRSGKVNVGEEAKLAFSKYANYILYGEDSDKMLEGEYDESDVYKLDEMRSEDEKTVTNYFKTANEFLTNFESLIGNDVNGELMAEVNNYRADFELVRLTFNKEYINEEELIDVVLKNGLEDVKIWITNKYADLAKSNYDSVKQYVEAEISYYQLYAEYLEKAKDVGCLNMEGGIACADYSDDELELQIEEAFDEADGILWVATNNVVEKCWTIEKLMNGEGVS